MDQALNFAAGIVLILGCFFLMVCVIIGIMRVLYWNFGAKWPWDK